MSLQFLTAATSLGGYITPPKSWKLFVTSWIGQVAVMTILVHQTGRTNILASIIISVLFLHFIIVWKSLEDIYLPDNLSIKKSYYNKYIAPEHR